MKYFLGIDIGSSYKKFVVIDELNKIHLKKVVKTMTRYKEDENFINEEISNNFDKVRTGVTGYGRFHQKNAEVIKTELYCASAGLSEFYPYDKTIIDIGGEDIKIIKSAANGKVIDFYMNSKCAAGTGAFITEVAERAEIDIKSMSALASKSLKNKELNSFCTVFAKTEIMEWIFEQTHQEDIAKGIYISIVNRIKKIPVDLSLPLLLIGGVAEYHPYIKNVIEDSFGKEVIIPEFPQYINAFGAAIFAKQG